MRISNSFSEGEIQVLEFVVQTLLRGGTPTMAARHKDFPSLCRKVQAMKHKVIEQKSRPVPEESSVGTVSAPHADEHADAADADAVNEAAEGHGAVSTNADIARAV
jgi:hypothetical protein